MRASTVQFCITGLPSSTQLFNYVKCSNSCTQLPSDGTLTNSQFLRGPVPITPTPSLSLLPNALGISDPEDVLNAVNPAGLEVIEGLLDAGEAAGDDDLGLGLEPALV